MQTKVFQKIAHPWLLGVSLLMVGLFAGAGIQMMRAQTYNSPFIDAQCGVGEACNPSAPLLSSGDITLSGNLTVNGTSLTLGPAGKISRLGNTTPTPTGQAINVVSTNDYAIVGSSSSNATPSHAGIFASGTNTASGLYATTENGNAIYGKVISGAGLAGYFEGNVTLGRASTPSVTGIGSNLTLAKGSLTVSDRATVKDIVALNSLEVNGSLIVNGQQVSVGETRQRVLFASLVGTSGTQITFTGSQISGTSSSYRLIGYQVFFTQTAGSFATTRTWAPASALVATQYTECSSNAFVGSLRVTNNTGQPVSIRVLATYQLESVTCANADVTPPTAITITSPASGGNVSGSTMTITATATDPSTPITFNYFVNGTNIGNNTSGTFNAPLSTTLYPYSPPKLTIYVTATDAQGNVGTSLPIQVNYVNNLCNPICGGIQTCQYVGCTGPTDYRCLDPDVFVNCGGPAT